MICVSSRYDRLCSPSQIDSLLSNIAPKASHIPPLDKLLHELHARISSTKEVGPQHPLEAARKLAKHGIAVPYPLPLPSEDTNWKVAFLPPSDIAVVGSWGNKMTVKRQDGAPFTIDIAVEMPAVSLCLFAISKLSLC